MSDVYKYAAIGLMALAGSLAAGLFEPVDAQDPARQERKVAKEYGKALQKAGKAAAKDIRIAIRPGSKVFPEGKGDERSELRMDGLRLGDLGVSFYTRGPGVVIEQIDPRSAFAEYGFREGDRIMAVGEDPVTNERDFLKHVFSDSRRAGKIGVQVLHDDDRLEVIQVAPSVLLEGVDPGLNDPLARLGVMLGDGRNELRVVEVVPQTPAELAGVRRGDVILGFEDERIKTADQLRDLMGEVSKGDYILRVQRDDSRPKLVVKLK